LPLSKYIFAANSTYFIEAATFLMKKTAFRSIILKKSSKFGHNYSLKTL